MVNTQNAGERVRALRQKAHREQQRRFAPFPYGGDGGSVQIRHI